MTLGQILGLLVALLVLRVALPPLVLEVRYRVGMRRSIVLCWLGWRAKRTWRPFCRAVGLARIVREGRTTHRSALWSLMPGVRVERKAPDAYVYPRLRVRPDGYGLVATVRTTTTVGLDELADQSDRIADEWGCTRVQVTKIKPRKVRIRAFRYEPLDRSFPSRLVDASGESAVTPGSLTSADDIDLIRDQDGNRIPVNLRESAHGLVAGITRSGKSITVNTLLASASLMRDVRLCIIDPNLAAAAPWWRTAYRVSEAQHPDEPTEILSEIRAEMESRQGLFWNGRTDKLTEFSEDMPLYVLAIDELTNYTKHSDKKAAERFNAELLAIASQGAKFGVRLWLIAQKPSADILPTAIRTNLSSRICHRVDTTEDFLHLFPDGRNLGISAADREMPPGVAIAHMTGMNAPTRAKSVFLPTESCWTLSDTLVTAGYGVRELPGPVLTETTAA